MRRQKIKTWIRNNFEKNRIHLSFQTIKYKFYNIYIDILSETSYLKTNNFMERLFHIMNDLFSPNNCKCGNKKTFKGIYDGYVLNCKIHANKNGEILLNNEDIKCSYGCGKLAKYKFKNKKYCCEKTYTKCTNNRKKYGSKGSKNPMFGKSARKYSIDDWYAKYKILFDLEEVRIKYDKIEAKCKKCGKWFLVSYENLRARFNALDHGNKRNYFFCSKECKVTSGLYRLKYEPGDLKDYINYQRLVKIKTENTIKRNRDKIKNIELRNRKNSIDHKYSVREAFENNIDIDIVSHWKNLEIITIYENSRKNKKCSITIEELKNQIFEAENGKN